ncbi:MAG: hypothetical protein VX910_05285 [Candidatus Latescibacterota bacterium]|nr:hypothetical protein [Candidatus Latescibacterota bacterium]
MRAQRVVEDRAAYRKGHPLKDSIELVPLTDLGDGVYKGEAGGSHPDGQNVPPEKHLGARLEFAALVVSWGPMEINHRTA